MVRVTRSSVLLKIQDLLGLQSGAQAPPVECKSDIQPVLEAGPRYTYVLKHGNQTTSSSTYNLYTTPADKDFYLTFANLSLTKDAVSDNTQVYIQITQNGATILVAFIPTQTTTAGSWQIHCPFPYPIKVDRNTNILLAGTFTAGTFRRTGTIGGFILE